MMVVAIALAFVAVVVAARWINAQASGNTAKVAVAQVDINLGARITPDMVRLVDWPASVQPPGAIKDDKALESRVTRTSITRGEAILEAKLAPPGTLGGLSAVVAEGKRAMTVRVNDVVGVAGFALPGNYVDILVNTQEEGQRTQTKDPTISKIVLERILVLAVAQESSRDETKPKVVNAVTLELTPEQVEKLDLARSVGSLSLVLRKPGRPESRADHRRHQDHPAGRRGAGAGAESGGRRPGPGPQAGPGTQSSHRAATRRESGNDQGLDRSSQQF